MFELWILIVTFKLIGRAIWKEYPTLEMLMEMVITNTCSFPPVTSADEAETLHARERQVSAGSPITYFIHTGEDNSAYCFSKILALEKQEILEFEGHLAAATSSVAITEANSLLLPKLMSMNVK